MADRYESAEWPRRQHQEDRYGPASSGRRHAGGPDSRHELGDYESGYRDRDYRARHEHEADFGDYRSRGPGRDAHYDDGGRYNADYDTGQRRRMPDSGYSAAVGPSRSDYRDTDQERQDAGHAYGMYRRDADDRRQAQGGFDRGSDTGSYGNGGHQWQGSRGNYGGGQQQQAESHRGRGPRNYQRADDRVREDVCQRLMDDHDIDASGIEVEVTNGEVILSGTVDSKYAKRLAEDCADSVGGIANVQNNLRVGATTKQSGDTGTGAARKSS